MVELDHLDVIVVRNTTLNTAYCQYFSYFKMDKSDFTFGNPGYDKLSAYADNHSKSKAGLLSMWYKCF